MNRNSYTALGLLANANIPLNGAATEEDDEELPTASTSQANAVSPSLATQPTKSTLPKGKGRLIRDAAGRVIGVDLPEDDESDAMNNIHVGNPDVGKEDEDTPWGAPMTEDRPVVPVPGKTSVVRGGFSLICYLSLFPCRFSESLSMFIALIFPLSSILTWTSVPVAGLICAPRCFINDSELENLSAAGQGQKKVRTVSTHQIKWLQELVTAYGDDVEAMAHDRRRNVWQKTAGEIRRL